MVLGIPQYYIKNIAWGLDCVLKFDDFYTKQDYDHKLVGHVKENLTLHYFVFPVSDSVYKI